MAAFVGLAFTDTVPGALVWTTLLAVGAGDSWARRHAPAPLALKQRALGAAAVLGATSLMLIPAVVVLLIAAYTL